MSNRKRSYLLAVVFLLAASTTGYAQQQRSLEGAYRGSMVCEHLPGTAGILRAPLDIIVTGTTVIAARPIFNRDGTRVVGSEIAGGSMNSDGTLHLSSTWAAAGATFKGNYNGTLHATGGTITGTEEWRRLPANSGQISRTCYGAYVRSPVGPQAPGQ
jgi:hypothetical protein